MASDPPSIHQHGTQRGKRTRWRAALSLTLAALFAALVLMHFFVLGPLIRMQLSAAGLRDVTVRDAGLTLGGHLAVGQIAAIIPQADVGIEVTGARLRPVGGEQGWRLAVIADVVTVNLPELVTAAGGDAVSTADEATTAQALLSLPFSSLAIDRIVLQGGAALSVSGEVKNLRLSRDAEDDLILESQDVVARAPGATLSGVLSGRLASDGLSAAITIDEAAAARGNATVREMRGIVGIAATPDDLTALRITADMTIPSVEIGDGVHFDDVSIMAEYGPGIARFLLESAAAEPSPRVQADWLAPRGWRGRARLPLAALAPYVTTLDVAGLSGEVALTASLETAAPFAFPEIEEARGQLGLDAGNIEADLADGIALVLQDAAVEASIAKGRVAFSLPAPLRGKASTPSAAGWPETSFEIALDRPLEAWLSNGLQDPKLRLPNISAALTAAQARAELSLADLAMPDSGFGVDGELMLSATGRIGDITAESIDIGAPFSFRLSDGGRLSLACVNGAAKGVVLERETWLDRAAFDCLKGVVRFAAGALSFNGDVADIRAEQGGMARLRSGPARFGYGADGSVTVALESATLTSLARPALFAPLSASANISGSLSGGLDFTAQAANVTGDFVLQAKGQHRGDRGTAKLTLFPISFFPEFFDIGALSPAMGRRLTRASGTLEGGGTLGWGKASGQTALTIRTTDLAFTAQGARFSGIETDFTVNSLTPPVTTEPQKLRIAEIASVIPVTEVRTEIGIAPSPALVIGGAKARMAGGTIRVDRTEVPLSPPVNATITIRADGVDLATLIELLEVQGLQAEGTLQGALPLRIEDSEIRFAEAALAAAAQGTLRYSPEDPPAFLQGTDQRSKLLRQALQNFRYDRLTLTLDGALGGQQVLRLSVGGSNPDFFDGRRVNLNVNIKGPLDSVVRQTEASISGQGISLDTINALPEETSDDADTE